MIFRTYFFHFVGILDEKASNFALKGEILNVKPNEIIYTDYKWKTILIQAALGLKVKVYCELNRLSVCQFAPPKQKKNHWLGSAC